MEIITISFKISFSPKDEKAYLFGRKINGCITIYEEELQLS